MKITEANLRDIILEFMLQEKLGFMSLEASVNSTRTGIKLSINKEDEDEQYLLNDED